MKKQRIKAWSLNQQVQLIKQQLEKHFGIAFAMEDGLKGLSQLKVSWELGPTIEAVRGFLSEQFPVSEPTLSCPKPPLKSSAVVAGRWFKPMIISFAWWKSIGRMDNFQAARHLEAGVDPNEPDDKGITPLMHALQGWNGELVQLLIAYGADIDQPSGDGAVPREKMAGLFPALITYHDERQALARQAELLTDTRPAAISQREALSL